MDIRSGGSLDSNLIFYDQMVRVEKGWVEHEFVLFIICHIATWNKVAKWVNILQESPIEVQLGTFFLENSNTTIDNMNMASNMS